MEEKPFYAQRAGVIGGSKEREGTPLEACGMVADLWCLSELEQCKDLKK